MFRLETPSPILTQIERIRRNRVSGASQLALESLKTLRLAVESFPAESLRELLGGLKEVCLQVYRAKPSMASLAHLAGKFLWRLKASIREEATLEENRTVALRILREMEKEFLGGLRKAAVEGSKLVCEGSLVATCSYSSMVAESLRLAKLRNVKFKVLVAESRLGNLKHGSRLAEQLSKNGIESQVFPDHRLGRLVEKASMVLLGADGIQPDGTFVNGFPSLALVREAAKLDKPIYVVCDSSKTSPFLLEVKEGFDVIPLKLVRGVATERGILGLKEVENLLEEAARYGELLL